MGDRAIRLGLVGFGEFGRAYADTIRNLADANLFAVIDTNRSALDSARDNLPGVFIGENLDEAVRQNDVDAWVVACSTKAHVECARICLDAGKPVLLEKPIAGDLKEAMALESVVVRSDAQLMMGHIVLFNSEFRQLQSEAQRRGSIRFIDAVRHRPVETMAAYPGETPFHLTMVHDLYCVLAMMDRAEPISINATVRRGQDGSIDTAIAQLSFPNGCLVSLTASFLTPEGMPRDGFDRMEVFGEGWAARIRANPRPIEVWDDRARYPMTLELGAELDVGQENRVLGDGMLSAQIRHFCSVVRGDSEVPVGATFGDAIQVQQWIEKLTKTIK